MSTTNNITTTEAMDQATSKKPQGFAALPRKERQAVAQRGGRNAHTKGTAHEFTPEEARAAGKKGGVSISQDREHMAFIGRKGGQKTAQDPEHMRAIGAKGGAKIAQNRERMSELGKRSAAKRWGNAEQSET
jgi:general stress protein YciG